MNKKKIAIIATCCLLAVGIVGGVYFLKTSQSQLPTGSESKSLSHLDEPASSDIPAISSSAAEYSIPPIPLPPKTETANSEPEENSETTTKNPDGTTSTEINRPEWSKPEGTPPKEPAGPPKDETNPDNSNTSKPEDNSTTTDEPTVENPKPNTPEPPTGGETNHKGEIFVPGFGWIKDEGGGVTTIPADNAGWEDSPVIGH